jgi:hypothetical protein
MYHPDPDVQRYGHHPDRVMDFCIEVDCCEGLVADVQADFATYDDVCERFTRAREFIAGVDEYAINAKAALNRATDALKRYAPKRPQ